VETPEAAVALRHEAYVAAAYWIYTPTEKSIAYKNIQIKNQYCCTHKAPLQSSFPLPSLSRSMWISCYGEGSGGEGGARTLT
jgi:hypothetical protein